MGGLVEDLLLLAELDRGRPLRAERVDLHRICADAVDDANAVPHVHELTLQPGAPVVVVGDDERLAQVAHNLVRNALGPHAARHGRRRVDRRGAGDGVHRGHRQRPGHPAGRGGPGLRPLLPGRPVAARARAPGSGWPSCGPSPRRSTAGPRWSASPQGGASIVVKIPAGRGPGRAGDRPIGAGALTATALRRRARTASSTVANLTSVSAASASGSESATTPPPARSVSVRHVGVEPGAADADHPFPVAAGADPADRPGPVAPLARLVGGDEGQRLGAGRAADRGRGMEALQQLEHADRVGAAEAPLDPGAEVGHRAEGDQRGLVGTVSSVAERCRGWRRCRRRRSRCSAGSWPTRPGRAGRRRRRARSRPAGHGAGQGVARDPVAVAGDQELGAGAEEGALGYGHGEDGAVGLAGPQAAQDGRQGERSAERGP